MPKSALRPSRRPLAALAVACAAGAALPATAAAAERLYTVTPGGLLLGLQSDKPAAVLSSARLQGLQSGEEVVALDVRPATASLYGVTNRSRVLRIEPTSGVVRPVMANPFAPPLAGDAAGFDFNPVVDRIRLVTPQDQNLRVNPDTGTTSNVDPALRYAEGDPAFGANPYVPASAYTQPFPGAATTQLFGLDAARGTLVLQEPANAGVLRTVAPLTLRGRPVGDLVGPVSFDIAGSGRAFAAFRLDAETRAATLFSVNLQTGALQPVDIVGPARGLRTQGLATAGTVPDDERRPLVVLAANKRQRLGNVLRRGVRFELSCNEACLTTATLSIGRRTVGRGVVVLDQAGKGNLRFRLTRSGRRAVRGSFKRRLVLRATIVDYAGNRQRQSENITLIR